MVKQATKLSVPELPCQPHSELYLAFLVIMYYLNNQYYFISAHLKLINLFWLITPNFIGTNTSGYNYRNRLGLKLISNSLFFIKF